MPGSKARLLLAARAMALLKHIWFLIAWMRAFDRGQIRV